MIKVKELKDLLNDLPEDSYVILSKDGGGNGYSPFDGYARGKYIPENTWSGEFYSNKHLKNYDDKEKEDINKNSVECVTLYPIN